MIKIELRKQVFLGLTLLPTYSAEAYIEGKFIGLLGFDPFLGNLRGEKRLKKLFKGEDCEFWSNDKEIYRFLNTRNKKQCNGNF